LARYAVIRGGRANEYELTIEYADDEDLDRVVYDLLREISSTADLRNCFVETDVREIGSERRW
jgi:hypothetical protein